jgi:hypothetical protein
MMTYRTCITPSRKPVGRHAALAPTLALLLAACSGPADEGKVRTETRAVGEFHSIDLRGTPSATLQVGPAASLSVTAAEDILAKLSTEVRNGTLVVEPGGRGWMFNPGKVDLHITVPLLREAIVSGAGDLQIMDARGESLRVTLQGAGSLSAGGEIGDLTATINGAGDAKLSALHAQNARVTVNGAGSITVQVTGSLSAAVNGVGSVHYIGTPAKLETSINGVGDVSQLPPMTVEPL